MSLGFSAIHFKDPDLGSNIRDTAMGVLLILLGFCHGEKLGMRGEGHLEERKVSGILGVLGNSSQLGSHWRI